jgi:hypothetical protein
MTKPRNPSLRQEEPSDKERCGWLDLPFDRNAEFRNLKDGQKKWEGQSIRFCASSSDIPQQWKLASERLQASESDSVPKIVSFEQERGMETTSPSICSQDS